MQQFSLPAQPLRYAILGTRLGLKKHPLAGKALPTSIGFAFGDCLTQHLNKSRKDEAYDYSRTAKMGVLGAVVAGPIGLWWWRQMASLPGPLSSLLPLKIVLDQVLGCILWQAAFLSVHEPYRVAAVQLMKTTSDTLQDQTSCLRKRLCPAPAA